GGANRYASPASQYVCDFVNRRLYESARTRSHDHKEHDFRERSIGIVLIERSDRNKDRVVARLPEEITKRFHHTHDSKRIAVDSDFLVERIFIRKECLLHVDADDHDIGPVLHVDLVDETTARDVLRLHKLVVRRDTEENRRVGLLVLISNGGRD